MYDRCAVEIFIAKRYADPSIVPVISKGHAADTRTPEERKRERAWRKADRNRLHALVWKYMGYSDEEIRRRLRK
jgi:hypothetical protein